MKFRVGFSVKLCLFITIRLNEFGNFLEFIYFSLFAILVNLPNQLVIVICDPALKN